MLSLMSENKEYKYLQGLGPMWKVIVNTLKNMQAYWMISAVVQALSRPSAQAQLELDCLLPGVSYSVCSSASQVRAAAEALITPLSSASSMSPASPVTASEEDAVKEAAGCAEQQEAPESESDSDDGGNEKMLEEDIKTLTEKLQDLELRMKEPSVSECFTSVFTAPAYAASSPRSSPPPSRWSGVIRDVILVGQWQAVFWLNQQEAARWEVHDLKLLQQALKTNWLWDKI